ncbi:lamin tail domain-containing protein [Pontiellaceae bacterium B12227]|nr:lamin tail domain-containing protein [Pontiellaceae bacterium B12227]
MKSSQPFHRIFSLIAALMAGGQLAVFAADSVVVFNEAHYHPADDNTDVEYIELYNQLAVDVELSNWRIDGDINFDFPEGTVIGARSYLVVAKDPGALEAATGYSGALGPYDRDLSNSGDPVILYNNNRSFRTLPGGTGSAGSATAELQARRIMDELNYEDTAPWPLGPDGSGFSLAKIDPATGTAEAGNWRVSTQPYGTPGSVNTFSARPTIAFNELCAATAAVFQIEIMNYGPSSVSLTDWVIGSSNPLHADYIFPVSSLPAGAYLVLDAATVGFTPEDNNRLFLYNSGKSTLVDTARVDDGATARNPDGSGAWMRPVTSSFGNANQFDLDDRIVINEILYHAPSQRSVPAVTSGDTTVQVLDYDSEWRYNLDAGTAGLPAGWAATVHPVDGSSWASGPGLLGVENSAMGEPLITTITLTDQITYYFETDFVHSGTGTVTEMVINHYIDDGAVFYLNGVEVGRFNMTNGSVTATTPSSVAVGNAALNSLTVSDPDILAGTNRLSVEVHQRISTSSDIVFGAQVILNGSEEIISPEIPFAEREEEWVELFNRSSETVDLTGWELDGGIGYDFSEHTTIPPGGYLVVAKDASALALKHPGIAVLGDYSGRLANAGEEITLVDASGNVADEVRYYDSGKWHSAADGGGSSLELRDPDSDNALAGAWAPSDESVRSGWQTITYKGIAVDDGIGHDVYYDFIVGLLDEGEFLIDDVSVIENDSVECIQNGSFEGDAVGAGAEKWRALGTHGSHGKTVVVVDPDDAGNQCLHVVATGPTKRNDDKLETTFADSKPIVPGNSYRISFRAKWLSGMSMVNTRLYFNYLQKTSVLDIPEVWGTPGVENTAAVINAGPDLCNLSHSPVVPAAGEAVTLGVDAADPDGISSLTLYYSIDDGTFQSVAMSPDGSGRYSGTIPGQSASSIVRFYVRGEDALGAESFFPVAAEKGGALYKVEDGAADTTGLRHNFRIVMSGDDWDYLFLNWNRMSNHRMPVTVIEDETTVYYDAKLRLKASANGRYTGGHGFNIAFQPDQLFRGVHQSISVERSGGYKQTLAKHLYNRAGGDYHSSYDDVAKIMAPDPSHNAIGLLYMTRHTKTYWDGLFPDADESGVLFNLELHYSPNTTTDGDPESYKVGRPYNHTNGAYDLEDRGDDKEPYRWGFEIRSARDRDDYSRLIELNQAMELSGAELKAALDPLIDVDQWMRTLAMMSLNGTDDVYTRYWEHNFRFFVRPTDQKIMIVQWDMDRAFGLSIGTSVIPTVHLRTGNPVSVAKMFDIPEYRRLFDGHLKDLNETTINSTYATSWATHFKTILGTTENNKMAYIDDRAATCIASLPSSVSFEITSNGGADLSEEDSAVDLEGIGWVDVFSIAVNGIETPVEWSSSNRWKITVPIAIGANELTLTALNHRGVDVGSDSITVTNASAVDLASADNTIISELHYHPADASPSEIAAGFNDDDDFEFVELCNVGTADIDLTNIQFTKGITYIVPSGTLLEPGERLIIVANQDAFEFRYGTNLVMIAGEYTGKFDNSGERVLLEAANGIPIADFTYSDDLPWPESADGAGYSLVFGGGDASQPLAWRSSTVAGGNPGFTDAVPYSGGDLNAYALSGEPTVKLIFDAFIMNVHLNLGANDAALQYSFSTNLFSWTPATNFVGRQNNGDGTSTISIQSPYLISTEPKQFGNATIHLHQD